MFVSDNVSCVCPEVMRAIEAANIGDAVSYGGDSSSNELDTAFSTYFETPVTAFPASTGTAANALALAFATPRFAAIYCHESAHVETTECGASEAWAGGSKLILLPGDQYRIDVDTLKSALARVPRGRPQSALPAVVSLTQATEVGTIYSLDQITKISRLAHDGNLLVHMDGARFSNALVALGCSPADMTWRAGVDVLSYGATKNGGMCAEGVVIFNSDMSQYQLGFLRRRNGQLFSKMRYLSVQLHALIRDGVAEKNALHANRMAARLATGLAQIPGARLLYPVEINEIFIFLPENATTNLAASGYAATLRNDRNGPHYRFVTAWNSTSVTIDQFITTASGQRQPGSSR
jgi:threonine aldolase